MISGIGAKEGYPRGKAEVTGLGQLTGRPVQLVAPPAESDIGPRRPFLAISAKGTGQPLSHTEKTSGRGRRARILGVPGLARGGSAHGGARSTWPARRML